MKGKLIKREKGYAFISEDGTQPLGSTLSKAEGKKLSLKNCQAIERGYDLDELFDEVYRSIDYHEFDLTSFVLGFQKALEILGDKKFSEEQMRRAYLLGRGDESIVRELGASNKEKMQYSENLNQGFESFLSLQQTEWDVIVETKKVIDETKIVGSVKGVKGSGNKVTTYKSVPKLDVDGCLILKRI